MIVTSQLWLLIFYEKTIHKDVIKYLLGNTGNGELLELRLLETGFLSRFQNKMSRF